MSIQNLVTHLEKKKAEIQNKIQETSGIYKAKVNVQFSSSTLPNVQNTNLNSEDRLRLFALENERLRALLKTINDQSEVELKLINAALLELEKSNNLMSKRSEADIEKYREEIRVLNNNLRMKNDEQAKMQEQMKQFELLLNQEKSKTSEQKDKYKKLKLDLADAKASNEFKRNNSDIDVLLRNKIQLLEKSLKDLQDEKMLMKLENQQLSFRLKELNSDNSKGRTVEHIQYVPSNPGYHDDKNKQIFEELSTVKEEIMNFNKTQKRLLETIKEETDKKHGSVENGKGRVSHQLDINFQKSLYRNFPNGNVDRGDQHIDLSLNLPPDFDNFESNQTTHYSKLKQIVKLLTEKQSQTQNNLESKLEKIKELKKTNKQFIKENEILQKEVRDLQKGQVSNLAQVKKVSDEVEKLKYERNNLNETNHKLSQKVEKHKTKIEELKESERKLFSLEKQNELMLSVNNKKNQEINSLLNELNEKQEVLNQVVSKSQMNYDTSNSEAEGLNLKSKYIKLKQLFVELREAYFQLHDDYSQIEIELEKEIKLRQNILEDFLKRSDFFEGKIAEFRDFQDRLIETKRLIVNR